MPIYDNDRTTNYQIGKIYDNDQTTNYQIGKIYDNDQTTNYLIYTAETVLSALSAASVSSGNPYDTMYSAYATSPLVDCYVGDTISFTVYAHMYAWTGGEHGSWGAVCLQLVKRVNGVDTVVYDANTLSVYNSQYGFACGDMFSIGTEKTVQANFSYTVPSGGAGSYYVRIRSAFQRAASDLSPTGYAQAYTSEITVK